MAINRRAVQKTHVCTISLTSLEQQPQSPYPPVSTREAPSQTHPCVGPRRAAVLPVALAEIVPQLRLG